MAWVILEKKRKNIIAMAPECSRSPPCTPRAAGRTIPYCDGSTYLALRP
ncbi:MAG: hypothetical protein WBZ20_19625 [Nitrososphaeraceae archaeon]